MAWERTQSIAAAGVVTALLAAGVAYKVGYDANVIAARQRGAETFLTLRQDYTEMISRFHLAQEAAGTPDCRSGIALNGNAYGRSLKAYWEQVFDEWYVTQKLDPDDLGDLWPKFYTEVVLSALQKEDQCLNMAFSCLSATKFTRGVRLEFSDQIKALAGGASSQNTSVHLVACNLLPVWR